MWLRDWETNANVGFNIFPAIKLEYVVLIVSPTMDKGFTDYEFTVTKIPRHCRGWGDVWDDDGWRDDRWDD